MTRPTGTRLRTRTAGLAAFSLAAALVVVPLAVDAAQAAAATPAPTSGPTSAATPAPTSTSAPTAAPTPAPTPAPTGSTQPGKVTGVTVTAATGTTITLEWTAVPGATAYRVSQLTGDVIGGVGTSAVTRYTITGLKQSTAYVFFVRAVGADGTLGPLSDPVDASTPVEIVRDTTPPSTPGTPVASAVTASGATLTWTESTDPGGTMAPFGVAGYDLYQLQGTVEAFVGSSTTTTYAVTGLAGSTSYAYVVRARDRTGNRSDASPAAAFTTLAGRPDKVTGVRQTSATGSTITLEWDAVPGDVTYQVEQLMGDAIAVVGSSAVTRYTVTGLWPMREYAFQVRAVGSAGDVGVASDVLRAFTLDDVMPPPASCKVAYSASSWGTGFTAGVRLTNTGTSPLTWSLGFTFANGQKVTQGWSATWTQTGSAVTATGMPWNATLAPGASTDIGFNGSHGGTNTAPTGFTVNGAPCTTG